MTSPTPTPTPPPALPPPIPDSPHPTSLPLPLSASLILTSLPHDAHAALADAGDLVQKKVTIRFQAIASAPVLRTKVFKISSSQRFETVVGFLRRRLEVGVGEGVFCYVNSVFAPGLDEGVGGLWRCFKTDDQLIVAYSMTPAFG